MSVSSGNGTASLSDLKDVLKDTLEARGSLNQIKARIRAEIFAALDDQSDPKPKLSNENLILNELIREYLEYNGYRHTLSVFLPESGQPSEKPFHRDFLSSELHIVEDPRFKHIPLLYSVLASRQQLNREHANANYEGAAGLAEQQLDRFAVESNVTARPNAERLPPHSSNSDDGVVGRGPEPSPLMFKK